MDAYAPMHILPKHLPSFRAVVEIALLERHLWVPRVVLADSRADNLVEMKAQKLGYQFSVNGIVEH